MMPRLTERIARVPRAHRVAALAVVIGVVVVLRAHGGQRVEFNRDVRPILNESCIACHGGVKRSAGFGLLFREDALVAGESGRPGIVPGHPNRSEMIRRVTHPDASMRMPHDGPPLSRAKIRTLRRWIAQGAEWEDHWAYLPPERRSPPRVRDESWPRNGIDRFVLARLERERLRPSDTAPCHVLARRVSLDLIGLPPSAGETDRFCADPSPDRYAELVDRLLDSPRFGEHWAAMWLDLARYADTKGYEKDEHRDIWSYRDWVIRALDADMPFDRFTIEQMAGDLLPDATDEQILATAFHRNTMTNDEGGTDDEEFRVAAVIDRVNTTMEVWQGTTMACVQCHSHPYDPIRHEEYFQVYALFNNTLDGDREDDGPRLPSYASEERRQVEGLLARIEEAGVETGRSDPAISRRLSRVFHPLGWMPAADYDAADGIMGTGDFVAALESRGWVRYERIELSGVGEVALGYNGRAGRVELRLDDETGPVIGRGEIPASTPPRARDGLALEPTLRIPIEPTEGRRDLVLVLLPSGDRPFRITSLARHPATERSSAGAAELALLKQELAAVRTEARTPVLQELHDRRRTTRVFLGGNWLVHGDSVAPGVPGSLPPLPSDEPADRLAFARWLVGGENPLTGRAVVNRLWSRLFGTGIVESLNDFGTMGEPPSHPELLDWLAIRLVEEHGWSVKSMLREMVLSATYQQATTVTPELLERDPRNRLLARGPRVRLSAEQVRDQALAVSGLLSERRFGPSVMPPQPPGVWSSPYNAREWVTSEGEDRYRRGVYTYWKRTAPYPSMVAFDSPSREFCVSSRVLTNTPLQALVTLNDPVYVEAAQALARRMSAVGGTPAERVRAGYRLALLHEPDDETVRRLVRLHASVGAEYRADPALRRVAVEPYRPDDTSPITNVERLDPYGAAEAAPVRDAAGIFAETPADPVDVAALTTVATVILNLDAFLTKE
jgi:hypothetical protein